MTLRSRNPIFLKIGQRSRSHGHKMYTAKMHHNSLLGVPINSIVGGWHEVDPN